MEPQLKRLRETLPFSYNAEGLCTLEKLKEGIDPANKELIAEIAFLAKTIFLPPECVSRIFSYLDNRSLARMRRVNKLFYSLPTMKKKLELIRERFIYSATPHIAIESIAKFDLVRAKTCLSLIEGTENYQEVYIKYLLQLIKTEPRKAFAELLVFYPNWVSDALKIIAINNLELALKLAGQILYATPRADALFSIACVVYPVSFERGRTLLRDAIDTLPRIHGDKTILQYVCDIYSFDPEFALEMIQNIESQDIRDTAYFKVSQISTTILPEIVNLILNEEFKIGSLAYIAYNLIKIDKQQAEAILKQALELARVISDNVFIENSYCVIANAYAFIDFKRALEIGEELGNPDSLKNLVCRVIAPNHLSEALDLFETIRYDNRTYEKLLDEILKQDPENALFFVEKSQNKDVHYQRIVNFIAKDQFLKALGIAHFIKSPDVKTKTLAQIAIKNMHHPKAISLFNFDCDSEDFFNHTLQAIDAEIETL